MMTSTAVAAMTTETVIGTATATIIETMCPDLASTASLFRLSPAAVVVAVDGVAADGTATKKRKGNISGS
jgi:hypothetical protein